MSNKIIRCDQIGRWSFCSLLRPPAQKMWKAKCSQRRSAWCPAVCKCCWHIPQTSTDFLLVWGLSNSVLLESAQPLGSRLDWHGNWHWSSLALSRLGPWRKYLSLRHMRNAWKQRPCRSGRRHDICGETRVGEAFLGRPGLFLKSCIVFFMIRLSWYEVWINPQRNRSRLSQYICLR